MEEGSVSTTSTESTEGGTQEATSAPAFQAPQSQDELNAIVEKRLARERAKYVGFEDYKAKAEQFDAAEEGKKSELEKLNSKATKAEERALKAERALLVSEVARTKGVPAELLVGSTKEELEASAEQLLAFKGVQEQAPAPNGPTSPALGGGSQPLPLNGDPLLHALNQKLGL